MSAVPFRRIYVDLPADVDAQLADRAKLAGMSKKAYLAQLITADAHAASTTSAATESKSHGKGKKRK